MYDYVHVGDSVVCIATGMQNVANIPGELPLVLKWLYIC